MVCEALTSVKKKEKKKSPQSFPTFECLFHGCSGLGWGKHDSFKFCQGDPVRNWDFMQISCTQDQTPFKCFGKSVWDADPTPLQPPAALNKSCYTTTRSVLLCSHLFPMHFLNISLAYIVVLWDTRIYHSLLWRCNNSNSTKHSCRSREVSLEPAYRKMFSFHSGGLVT